MPSDSNPVQSCSLYGQDLDAQPKLCVLLGSLRVMALLFANEAVLLPFLVNYEPALERFTAEYELAGIKISTSKSEVLVLCQKTVLCLLWVDRRLFYQVREDQKNKSAESSGQNEVPPESVWAKP